MSTEHIQRHIVLLIFFVLRCGCIDCAELKREA